MDEAHKKGAISHILLPKPGISKSEEDSKKNIEEIKWEIVNKEEEVYFHLLNQNMKQLMKSKHSPFAMGKLAQECGQEGEGELTQQILNNKIPQETLNTIIQQTRRGIRGELKDFIKALAYPKQKDGRPMEEFKWKFGKEEYQQLFKKTRESTACGPSGLHMSHWKACAEEEDLSEVNTFFIFAAFKLGFSYERWQNSWHCMLQKESKPYIHRLRIIQLFKGDFNGGLKYLLGRQLMYHMVHNKSIDKQAFGSIPGRTAHEALVTMHLIIDNYRVMKRNIAIIFNDAEGCFDRIRPVMNDIALRRLGCPRMISKCQNITQQLMKHRVKTAKGVSEGYIKWSNTQTIQMIIEAGITIMMGNIGGIGQGAGGSPVGCLAMILVMITTHKVYASGAKIIDPIKKCNNTVHVISYVDDNTIVQALKEGMTEKQQTQVLPRCISEWQKLLQVTGGDLALNKCSYSILQWKWYGAKAVADQKQDRQMMEIEDNKVGQQKQHISYIPPKQAQKILGVQMALDGNFTKEFETRREKCKVMAKKLYRAPLTTLDAFMVYETRFLPAMRYPLHIAIIDHKKLDTAQRYFTNLLLPKIGMNRKTPRAVVYAPTTKGGLGIKQLKTEQMIQHLYLFQGHIRRKDAVAESYLVQLRTQQLEIGSATPVLQLDRKKYCYGTVNTRIDYIWQISTQMNIKTEITEQWTPRKRFRNDQCIMDIVVASGRYSMNKNKLSRINACRLYLQITLVSELTKNDGKQINLEMLSEKGRKRYSAMDYPSQGKPDPYDWSLWREAIIGELCKHDKDSNTMVLVKPMVDKIRPQPWKVNTNDGKLIKDQIKGSKSVKEAIQKLDPKYRDIIGDIEIPMDGGEDIMTAIQTGFLVMASDGSIKEKVDRGTYAYKLQNLVSPKETDDNQFIIGSAYLSMSDKNTSTTAEQYGIIATLIMVMIILEVFQRDKIEIVDKPLMYIDNKEAIKRTKEKVDKKLTVKTRMVPDYDLWAMTNTLIQEIPIQIDFKWIKSHQIDHNDAPKEEDDNEIDIIGATINKEVDNLATLHYTKPYIKKKRPHYQGAQVTFSQEDIHRQDIRDMVEQHESNNDIDEYYKKKGWTDEQLKQIDWKTIGKFLQKLTPGKRCNAIQLLHGWQNTNKQNAIIERLKMMTKQ